MDNTLILFLTLVLFGYLYLYIGGRQYLRREGFADGGLIALSSPEGPKNEADKKETELEKAEAASKPVDNAAAATIGADKPIPIGEFRKPCANANGPVFMEMGQRMEAPYLQRGIQDVDDYEYNLVFQNEGDREMGKALQNKLQSQYPLDWSVQPPSSSHFQTGLKNLKESFENSPVQPLGENPYREISGGSLRPPDTSIQEMEERKILQTYRPSQTGDLTTYNLEDAQDLIKRIYNAKGLVPDVRVKENNVYEVIGTRKKDEKILYEDEMTPAQKAPVASAGEGTITVPPVATDVSAGLDPFFSPSPGTRMGRWDYQKFTPGLERMFAPTYPTAEWY